MSACNVIRTETAVHMLTDSRMTDPRQGNRSFGDMPKAWALPHLDAVVALRGWSPLGIVVQMMLAAGASSFDDLRAHIPGLLRQALGEHQEAFQTAPQKDFEVVVAGWSETNGAASYIIGNHTRYGFPAWTVQDLSEFSILPADAAMHERMRAALPHVATVEDFDPERDGPTLIDLQAENVEHGIGGFVQLTTVRPESITTKILRRR